MRNKCLLFKHPELTNTGIVPKAAYSNLLIVLFIISVISSKIICIYCMFTLYQSWNQMGA